VLTDVFIVASGTSRRHVITLAEETEMKLKEHDRRPLGREGMDEGTWVLLDLERLWADAPRLAFEPAV